MPQAILKPRKARPFHGRHPWVLDSAIDRVEGSPADGDVVDLLSDKGKFIARGVYNSHSRIRVRLYTWDFAEPLDEAFWRRRLAAAVDFRRQLGYDDPQGAARLVFSEGDSLSGLVVDRYADYLAVQVTALAVAVRLSSIVAMLVELTQPKGIMIRTERGVSRAEGIDHGTPHAPREERSVTRSVTSTVPELRDGLYWGVNLYSYAGERNIGDLRIWRGRRRENFDARTLDLLRLVEPAFTGALMRAGGAPAPAAPKPIGGPRLSQREREVALMIGEGLPDKVIAYRLGVEPSTVRTYLKRIFDKLGVHRRSGVAAAFARQR